MLPRVLPRGSMNQATVFYTTKWTKEINDLFILALCEQTAVGKQIIRGRPNKKAIEYAMDRVNGFNGTHFDYTYFLDRFRRLHKRYTMFKYIIDQPGVTHNENTHNVIADESVWNHICREHALAYAYMRQGDGSYDALQFIFTAVSEVPGQERALVEVIKILSYHSKMSVEVDNGVVDNGRVFDTDFAWYNSGNS